MRITSPVLLMPYLIRSTSCSISLKVISSKVLLSFWRHYTKKHSIESLKYSRLLIRRILFACRISSSEVKGFWASSIVKGDSMRPISSKRSIRSHYSRRTSMFIITTISSMRRLSFQISSWEMFLAIMDMSLETN